MIENFGRNIAFQPKTLLMPQTEDEVLQILKENGGRQIRTIGSLHSWSEIARTDDLVISLRHLRRVKIESQDGKAWARIGGGIQIKHLLVELKRQGLTLPSVGLITEQTIAGAVSTGTHGSGKHSLSHYVVEIRFATYDENGQPVVRTISDGPELRAARCALGCFGVILSVGIWVRPCYLVEEHFHGYTELNDVLEAEAKYPLQQFFLMPWAWDFIAQHRREVPGPRSWFAPIYRVYFWLTFDIAMHLSLVLMIQWLRTRKGVIFFYRRILPNTAIHNWMVADHSYDMLVMDHERFRHIEIEIFVRRTDLTAAMTYVKELLLFFHDGNDSIGACTKDRLSSLGLLDSLMQCGGTYTHHYPVCVRRVLADDTLVSMGSNDDEEDVYALSFISYARRGERQSFLQFADQLAKTTAALFHARPHWGKVFPLDGATVEKLYPHLDEFRKHCEQFDSQGRFRNPWIARLIFASKPSRSP